MEERIIVCSFRIEYLLLVLYGQFQRYKMCSAHPGDSVVRSNDGESTR